MRVKSCHGYFQISKHLGAISTFRTESEIWPFAESAFPQARGYPSKCLSKGGCWKEHELLYPALQPHFHDTWTLQAIAEASHVSAGMHQGPAVQAQVSAMLKLLRFSKICLNSVHDVCRTARYLDSIRVCYVWNVLTLHKFVRTEDYIKHKLAQGNHAASLPSPMHTRIDLLSAQTRNPFSPGSWFSEPTLKCSSSPKSEICSHFTLISAEFYFFIFFFFYPSVLPWWGLFFIAKNYILDKRKSGGSLKDILGSPECCQKAWGGTI